MAQSNLVNNIIKEYVKENWGSPFLAGFILFIIGAVFSLTLGWASLAATEAVYAFYALMVGFFLQFICYLKYSSRIEREAL